MTTTTLTATPGSFSITGATTTVVYRLPAAPGVFSLSGRTTGIVRHFTAAPGTFAMVGGSTTLKTIRNNPLVIQAQISDSPYVQALGRDTLKSTGL